MVESIEEARRRWNGVRYRSGMTSGHYESYFQRANHPTEPRAFWIRYTIFAPKGAPERAVGELWAMYFDLERDTDRVVAVREEHPIGQCSFSPHGLDARITGSELREGELQGEASHRSHTLGWDLRYASDERPVLMFPERFYSGPFPKAKALVGSPQARYDGKIVVDGEEIAVDGWLGSQNHNWGSKHTDDYAWGQVCGFDNAPDAFLECATARLRFGPIWTPRFTLLNLRVGGREYALNDLLQAVRADGSYRFFHWTFDSRKRGMRIFGNIAAPAEAFVGLTYGNPPGGTKTCLNTKVASCRVTLERAGMPPLHLETQHRAAFEILTDRRDHGVPILT